MQFQVAALEQTHIVQHLLHFSMFPHALMQPTNTLLQVTAFGFAEAKLLDLDTDPKDLRLKT